MFKKKKSISNPLKFLSCLSALRRVIQKYSANSLPSIPPDNEKKEYGSIHMVKTSNLLDMLHHFHSVESENPLPMESVGQVLFALKIYVILHSF